MRVLAIQSEVVYGHVGNGAARFALQRLGLDVLALPTVLFSNHPGHGGFTGEVTPVERLEALLTGLDERGWLAGCAGVLSGYLGEADQAGIVAEAVARVREANPDALYLCDPVFGDEGGIYARQGVAEAMALKLLPIADIATPNRFELETLSRCPVTNAESAIEAARTLGVPLVLATSVPREEEIATLAVMPADAWGSAAPRLPHPPHGTGDLLAALFLAHRLGGATIPRALRLASSSVDHMIRMAVRFGADEMPLIAAQAAIARPRPLLDVKTL